MRTAIIRDTTVTIPRVNRYIVTVSTNRVPYLDYLSALRVNWNNVSFYNNFIQTYVLFKVALLPVKERRNDID